MHKFSVHTWSIPFKTIKSEHVSWNSWFPFFVISSNYPPYFNVICCWYGEQKLVLRDRLSAAINRWRLNGIWLSDFHFRIPLFVYAFEDLDPDFNLTSIFSTNVFALLYCLLINYYIIIFQIIISYMVWEW